MGIIIGGNTLSGNFNNSGESQNTPTVVTNGLVLWLDAGNNASYINSSNYYDCGYGCQYYSSNPGCTNCNTRWKDMSGYGNDGTIQNGTPISYSNGSGGHFAFGASNYGIQMTNSSSLINLKTSQGGSGLTILIWAKSTGGTGAWRKLIGNWDGDNYIDLYQSPSGYWHQDGSGESLFVDGISVGNDTYYMPGTGWHQWGATNSNAGTLSNPTQSLTVGNEPNLTSYPWIGDIAIVQIYNRILTSDEIIQNYNNGRQRFGV